MIEVLAFEINARPAQFARQPFGQIQRGGASDEMAQIIGKLLLECGVVLGAEILLFQLLKRIHERFRHEPSAVRAETALRIGNRGGGRRIHMGIIVQGEASGKDRDWIKLKNKRKMSNIKQRPKA